MTKVRQYLPVACWALGAVLVVNTVRLVQTNRSLTSQIVNLHRSIALPAGARVPPIVGTDADGGDYSLDTASEAGPVLLLVFSPTCPACNQNWPLWDALVATQEDLGGKIVAVDISGRVRDDYIDVHGLRPHAVLTTVAPETAMSYRFRFTPQTLVLHHGQLVRGWTGVLRDEDVAAAVQALTGELAP